MLPEDLSPLSTHVLWPTTTCAHTHRHPAHTHIQIKSKNSREEDSGSLLKHFQEEIGAWGDGSGAQSTCLPHLHEDLSLDPSSHAKSWARLCWACDPSAEMRLLGLSGSRRTTWGQLSPSTLGDPGIELRSSSLVASGVTH